MTYHKIKGVEKTICTAEQKIAYNLAFSNYYDFKKEYDLQVLQIYKSDILNEFVQFCMKTWSCTDSGKFDNDAIFCALNAGAKMYFEAKYHILSSYEAIGKMFPAHYLRV